LLIGYVQRSNPTIRKMIEAHPIMAKVHHLGKLAADMGGLLVGSSTPKLFPSVVMVGDIVGSLVKSISV
jgi:hypothetical protein